MVIHTAYMKELTEWSFLKYDDRPALKSFYIFLSKCNCAMKTMSHLAILNHATKHAGSSSEAPLASYTVAWKRSENKMQRWRGCRLCRTSRILRICCRVCKWSSLWQNNGPPQSNKGSHPSSLKSIVSSLAWIPSPSPCLHTGPGFQTKTSAH